MASLVVTGLRPSGLISVWVNYQHLNSYMVPDQTLLHSKSEVVQKIGKARFIFPFDTIFGYYQCLALRHLKAAGKPLLFAIPPSINTFVIRSD
jgi:hypothetical protein